MTQDANEPGVAPNQLPGSTANQTVYHNECGLLTPASSEPAWQATSSKVFTLPNHQHLQS